MRPYLRKSSEIKQVSRRSTVVDAHFQPSKYAIYGITERGQRVCGWIAREKTGEVELFVVLNHRDEAVLKEELRDQAGLSALNSGGAIHQPAIYGITERGQRVCGWIAREKTGEVATTYGSRGMPRGSWW
jgi:hypothetical protein